MPMKKELYPPDWKAISMRIRERDGWCCKFCGVANGAIGARDLNGEWHDADAIESMNSDYGYSLFGVGYPKIIRIVLTVAHIRNPDPMCVDDDNLASLCQRCHNQLDAPMRAEHSKQTRQRKALEAIRATGQEALL